MRTEGMRSNFIPSRKEFHRGGLDGAELKLITIFALFPFRDYTQSVLKPVMNLEEQFNEFEYWEELGHV